MKAKVVQIIAIIAFGMLGLLLLFAAISKPADAAELPQRLPGWEHTVSRSVDVIRPIMYTVKSGDTMEQIAKHYKVPGGFERLHYVNRKKVKHADLIEVGTKLVIPTTNGKKIEYIPLVPIYVASSSSSYSYSTGTSNYDSSNPYVKPWGCEASHSQEWSDSGKYWGKYQFDQSTWNEYNTGGEDYGSATEAEQDAVAARVTYDAWPNC